MFIKLFLSAGSIIAYTIAVLMAMEHQWLMMVGLVIIGRLMLEMRKTLD